jgi:hypothetical protein
MPLERAASDPFVQPDTLAVSFEMHDPVSDDAVNVMVAKDALQKLGNSQDPIALFIAHRSTIEQLASRKFDRLGGGKQVQVRGEDLAA